MSRNICKGFRFEKENWSVVKYWCCLEISDFANNSWNYLSLEITFGARVMVYRKKLKRCFIWSTSRRCENTNFGCWLKWARNWVLQVREKVTWPVLKRRRLKGVICFTIYFDRTVSFIVFKCRFWKIIVRVWIGNWENDGKVMFNVMVLSLTCQNHLYIVGWNLRFGKSLKPELFGNRLTGNCV